MADVFAARTDFNGASGMPRATGVLRTILNCGRIRSAPYAAGTTNVRRARTRKGYAASVTLVPRERLRRRLGAPVQELPISYKPVRLHRLPLRGRHAEVVVPYDPSNEPRRRARRLGAPRAGTTVLAKG